MYSTCPSFSPKHATSVVDNEADNKGGLIIGIVNTSTQPAASLTVKS